MAAAENKFSIKLFNKWELEEINVEDLALAVSVHPSIASMCSNYYYYACRSSKDYLEEGIEI